MAPEQVVGGSIDPRADLFSVGVILWEAMTGARFWAGSGEVSILRRLVRGELSDRISSTEPLLPELLPICRRALSLHPDERFETALELKSSLDQLLTAEGIAGGLDLGEWMRDRFGPERERRRSTVERQLSLFEGQAVGAESKNAALLPGAEFARDTGPLSTGPMALADRSARPAVVKKSARRRWPIAAFLGVTLAACGAFSMGVGLLRALRTTPADLGRDSMKFARAAAQGAETRTESPLSVAALSAAGQDSQTRQEGSSPHASGGPSESVAAPGETPIAAGHPAASASASPASEGRSEGDSFDTALRRNLRKTKRAIDAEDPYRP
jgi:serine/threonine-protein kinase